MYMFQVISFVLKHAEAHAYLALGNRRWIKVAVLSSAESQSLAFFSRILATSPLIVEIRTRPRLQTYLLITDRKSLATGGQLCVNPGTLSFRKMIVFEHILQRGKPRMTSTRGFVRGAIVCCLRASREGTASAMAKRHESRIPNYASNVHLDCPLIW
jgi:hypothetical protein